MLGNRQTPKWKFSYWVFLDLSLATVAADILNPRDLRTKAVPSFFPSEEPLFLFR